MLPRCDTITPASLAVIRRNLATAEVQAEVIAASIADLKEQEANAVEALAQAEFVTGLGAQ